MRLSRSRAGSPLRRRCAGRAGGGARAGAGRTVEETGEASAAGIPAWSPSRSRSRDLLPRWSGPQRPRRRGRAPPRRSRRCAGKDQNPGSGACGLSPWRWPWCWVCSGCSVIHQRESYTAPRTPAAEPDEASKWRAPEDTELSPAERAFGEMRTRADTRRYRDAWASVAEALGHGVDSRPMRRRGRRPRLRYWLFRVLGRVPKRKSD